MTYLASPYSHPDPREREYRFEMAREVVSRLIAAGHVVFSPIVYSHQYAAAHGTDFASWQHFDLAMIDAAKELWVLTLDGWERSQGVAAEMDHARSRCMVIRMIDPDTLEVTTWTDATTFSS